jgi:hypothetical protein
MKNIIKFIGIAFVLLTLSVNSFAQAVSASAYAEAYIISPLAINKSVDLAFGNVAVNTVPGTIILSTAGVRTAGPGGAIPVNNPTGTVTAAEFEITGTVGQLVAVTLPTADVIVTHTNGTDVMEVRAFNCDPLTGFAIPSGGLQTLKVGATLNVHGSQLAGYYKTLVPDYFTVTVVYQ